MKATKERLESFLCSFREDHPAFQYGVPEIVRALRVLVTLEQKHLVPTDPDRLSAYIAPAVCASAEEQAKFREIFQLHFARSEPGVVSNWRSRSERWSAATFEETSSKNYWRWVRIGGLTAAGILSGVLLVCWIFNLT